MTSELESLVAKIRDCQICSACPVGAPLPHAPRPVLQVSSRAKLAICGQAPGTKVHASGRPFTDRSGDRLREWMGVSEGQFYDVSKVAVIPMGFCFPGQNAKGADLPPRAECRATWHDQLMEALPQLELILVVGRYAMDYHLKIAKKISLREIVTDYERYLGRKELPCYLPLPHPSWRNTHWLKKNPWFERDYVPILQSRVLKLISPGGENK